MLKKLSRLIFIQKIIAYFVYLYIQFVFKTSKWQFVNEDFVKPYRASNKPFIGCFWHGRLLMMFYAWRVKTPVYMLISAHLDGQLIARTIKHFGVDTIVGSTSKGGTKALRALLKLLKTGISIGITPDGPRGPGYKVSPGIISLSKLSGMDIVPASFATSRFKILRTWDKFFLALPFSKGAIVWGQPVKAVAPKASKEQLMAAQSLVEARLQTACKQADILCGVNSLIN